MYNKGDKFTDASEVAAYIDASGWTEPVSKNDVLYWRKSSNVSIEDMDIRFAVPLANAVETFKGEFPKLTNVASKIRTNFLGPSVLGSYDTDSHEVEFSNQHVSKYHYEEGLNKFKDSIASKFHPPGTDIGYTAYHELVHAMEERMYLDDHDYHGKNVLGSKRPSDVILERVQNKLNDHSLFFKEKVSGYAARTYAGYPERENMEFLAEAMSEAYTSKTPREIAVAVREEFTKLYHEIYD